MKNNITIIKHYLNITKPKIVLANILSTIAGLLLATKHDINYKLLIFVTTGTSLIIASSCVLNNLIDCDIDKKMERTKNRPLVQKKISKKYTAIYAIFLFITGILCFLITKTNILTIQLSIIGFIIYTVIYSLIMKRKSSHSIIIGSIAGAIPPIIGYCSITNELDLNALILLLIYITWQMPHFYSIAILRYKDYTSASIPILPYTKNIKTTKNYIVIYITILLLATIFLSLNKCNNYLFLYIISIINGYWLYTAFQGYKHNTKNNIWSKKMLKISICVITTFNILISIDQIIKQI